MKFEVENITPFDNANGQATTGKVYIYLDEGFTSTVSVQVKIPLDMNKTLEQTKEDLISEAKFLLKKIVNTI